MREGISTRETWPFECLHCLRVWEEEYVVHRRCDEHGNDVVVWVRDEVAVQPPWSGMTCPGCGCGTVTTFPTGYLAHHPEITLGRPALEIPAKEEPSRGGRWFASHGLLTLALLLPAGLGLYERLTAR
ncbi:MULTISPECIES: hypothetical protein [unclassified Microbispora]|uniref:hypothetical protein n=1 Tax=unclassified Microbispora TaxID=2614687 RepID=UPI001475373D|nr:MULTISPECIES: hypothetical protein [unclassified Microbispora]